MCAGSQYDEQFIGRGNVNVSIVAPAVTNAFGFVGGGKYAAHTMNINYKRLQRDCWKANSG